MADSVSSETCRVDGLRLHYLRCGTGPLMILLHGWPQTSHCWNQVIEQLGEDHTIVAPDMRGYGLSDKPADGYDKRRMAADMAGLVEALGFDRAVVVGHDRAARVAHRWALDRPDQVRRLVVLDVIPTREWSRRLDVTMAAGYWHWLFHLQPDLPERLVGQDIRGYLEYFFERWTYRRQSLSDGDIDHYVRAFSRPGALRAGFDDYRAHEEDLRLDDADATAGHKLTMPTLALWGSAGLQARLPILDIWRDYADDVSGAELPECGHFIAEEQPDAFVRQVRGFAKTEQPTAR